MQYQNVEGIGHNLGQPTLRGGAVLLRQPFYIFGIVDLESFGKLDIVKALLFVREGPNEETVDLTRAP